MNPLTIYFLALGLWHWFAAAILIAVGLWLLWRASSAPSPMRVVVGMILLLSACLLLQSCSTFEGLNQSTGYYHSKPERPPQ